jgi:5-formyltetrahydrofolate cyclo-ligase
MSWVQQQNSDGTGGSSFFMSKEQLREIARNSRKNLPSTDICTAGSKVLTYVKSLMEEEVWLLYAPIENEVPTEPLFTALLHQNRKIYFPLIRRNDLQFHRVQAWKDLKAGTFSFEPSPKAEPLKATRGVALVPGVLFSYDRQRLGFGKGFYDRFLFKYPDFIRVGLAYGFQVTSRWAEEPHDIRMDLIVTPEGRWGSKRIL